MKGSYVGRLCLLQYPDHLSHSRLLQLTGETRIVLTASTPELNLLQRSRAGGGVQGLLAGQQLLDLPRPVDYHHYMRRKGGGDGIITIIIIYTSRHINRQDTLYASVEITTTCTAETNTLLYICHGTCTKSIEVEVCVNRAAKHVYILETHILKCITLYCYVCAPSSLWTRSLSVCARLDSMTEPSSGT